VALLHGAFYHRQSMITPMKKGFVDLMPRDHGHGASRHTRVLSGFFLLMTSPLRAWR
jgi:hypothetical protein